MMTTRKYQYEKLVTKKNEKRWHNIHSAKSKKSTKHRNGSNIILISTKYFLKTVISRRKKKNCESIRNEKISVCWKQNSVYEKLKWKKSNNNNKKKNVKAQMHTALEIHIRRAYTWKDEYMRGWSNQITYPFDSSNGRR